MARPAHVFIDLTSSDDEHATVESRENTNSLTPESDQDDDDDIKDILARGSVSPARRIRFSETTGEGSQPDHTSFRRGRNAAFTNHTNAPRDLSGNNVFRATRAQGMATLPTRILDQVSNVTERVPEPPAPYRLDVSDGARNTGEPRTPKRRKNAVLSLHDNLVVPVMESLGKDEFLPVRHRTMAEATFEAVESVEDNFGLQQCLAQLHDLFPDIEHDYVAALFAERTTDGTPGLMASQAIVEFILDSTVPYPRERNKHEHERGLKRKASADAVLDNDKKWESERQVDAKYTQHAEVLLREEFAEVPVEQIRNILRTHRTLFRAHTILSEQLRTYDTTSKHIWLKLKARRIPSQSSRAGSALKEELSAARAHRLRQDKKHDQKLARDAEELRNEETARLNSSLLECGCCFTECALNRMVPCSGKMAHFFCHECVRRSVESELGSARCRPRCMDMSGCGADFSLVQMQHAFIEERDLKTFRKLESMQQIEDIHISGLEGVEECPFCEFRAVVDPVEIDKEFRCIEEYGGCGKISCRLCRLDTHVPRSCEEVAKDRVIDHRHRIEEAMTEALVRTCNKCKTRFCKESGCNKMTCYKCRNVQCYTCNQSIKQYDHFRSADSTDRKDIKKCLLYDNWEERDAEAVKQAEVAAFTAVREENPDLAEEEMKIKVSEDVQRDERERIARANAQVQQRQHMAVPRGPPAHLLAQLALPQEPPVFPDPPPRYAGFFPQAPGALRPPADPFGDRFLGDVLEDFDFDRFLQGEEFYPVPEAQPPAIQVAAQPRIANAPNADSAAHGGPLPDAMNAAPAAGGAAHLGVAPNLNRLLGPMDGNRYGLLDFLQARREEPRREEPRREQPRREEPRREEQHRRTLQIRASLERHRPQAFAPHAQAGFQDQQVGAFAAVQDQHVRGLALQRPLEGGLFGLLQDPVGPQAGRAVAADPQTEGQHRQIGGQLPHPTQEDLRRAAQAREQAAARHSVRRQQMAQMAQMARQQQVQMARQQTDARNEIMLAARAQNINRIPFAQRLGDQELREQQPEKQGRP